MRTIERTVYKFSELSDKAKQKAKDDHAAAYGMAWSKEYFDSLEALAAKLGGKLSNYEVDVWDTYPSWAKFEMPDMDEKDIRDILKTLGSYNKKTLRGNGDCVLTGYCGDEDAIDGFRRAFHAGERDLNKLMEAAFNTWIKAVHDECKGEYEDAQFSEISDANDYEYYENGELV